MKFVKTKGLSGIVIALLALAPVVSSATVTLEICYSDGALAEGSVGVLVADVESNGFTPLSDASVPGTLLAEGETIGSGDDRILAIFQADSGDHWQGGVGIFATLPALDLAALDIAPGTPLILYTFPDIRQLGARLALGDVGNAYRNDNPGASGGTSGFVAPAEASVHTLSALTSALGGDFDPQNPDSGETFGEEVAGLPGNGGGDDDHGRSRSTATELTSGVGRTGALTPGDLDYFSLAIDGLVQVDAHTTGPTDTIGYLYAPDGSSANDPAADDDAGGGGNFRSSTILSGTGLVTLAVRGKGDAQTGDYEVFLAATPLLESRPDITVGKTPSQQIGNGRYNGNAAGQTLNLREKRFRTSRFFLKGQNDGGLADTLRMRGARSNRNFRVGYLRLSDGRANVTGLLATGRYAAVVEPLSEQLFQSTIRPLAKVRSTGRGLMRSTLVASSAAGGADVGRNVLRVQVRKRR